MRSGYAVAAGIAGGFLLAAFVLPTNNNACCARVAGAVRARVAGGVGGWAASLLDGLNVIDHAPGLLDSLGVPYDS